MWMGTLTFGLVSVPVKLYSAVVTRSVHFHQLHAPDHARIYMKRVCPVEEEEVPYSEVVKGFEIAPERYVVIEPEEFAALEPPFTRTVDIEDFVELDEIDPIYLDQPYLMVPNKGGARSYRLLLEAMQDTGKVAIARIVLRSRERLVAIRPREGALLMTTMNFGDEIRSSLALRELEEVENVPVAERELSVARRLVESIAESFDITKYHDTYREALLDLIDRKAAGEEIVVEPRPKAEPLVAPDLMSALQQSLDQVRKRQDEDGARAPANKRGAARGEKQAPGRSGHKAPGTGAASAGNGKAPGPLAKKPTASKSAATAKKPGAKKPAAKKAAGAKAKQS
jgi:DNA end-binding protein Ku